jgi:hypothetical protein
MTHSYNCSRESWQLCLGCGAKVCACRGTARGQCPECYTGLLTNYYRIGHTCGYKACIAPAVTAVPRVKYACAQHALKSGYQPTRNPGDGIGSPTEHTQHVCRQLGIAIAA